MTTRSSPPGPPGLPFFGNVLDVWREIEPLITLRPRGGARMTLAARR